MEATYKVSIFRIEAEATIDGIRFRTHFEDRSDKVYTYMDSDAATQDEERIEAAYLKAIDAIEAIKLEAIAEREELLEAREREAIPDWWQGPDRAIIESSLFA